VTVLRVPNEGVNFFASGRKDSQTNQDKEDSLKKREKEAKDFQSDEESAKDQDCNFIQFLLDLVLFFYLRKSK